MFFCTSFFRRCLNALLCAAAVLAGLGSFGAAWAQDGGLSAGSLSVGDLAAWGAASNEVRTPQTTARLVAWAPQGIAAGQPLWLGLQFAHAPHWHSYWKNPGDAGMAATFDWQLPAGMHAGEVQWPAPVKITVGNMANYGYDGNVLLAVPVTVSQPVAGSVSVALDASWLVCRKECVPEQGHFRLQLPAGKPLLADAAAFATTRAAVPQTLAGTTVAAAVAKDGQSITFSSNTLPASWRGKTLNLYPEAPDVIPPAAQGQQHWQGSQWQVTLPLQAVNSALPASLPLVLALQGKVEQQASGQAIIRNAAHQPAYRVHASFASVPASATSNATTGATDGATASATLASQELSSADSSNQTQATQAAAGLPDVPNAANSVDTPDTAGQGSWWLALGAAFFGGLVLNLMPCVFPVLAIKLLGFARHAQHPRSLRLSGLAYSAGVLVSMLLLAGLLLLVRAGGEQLGWGFQLQNPYVVAVLAVLFTTLALNLAGVFDVGQVLPARWLQTSAQHPVADALLSGVLAVLVASPCSAPFMGASLGFALALPAGQALVLFAAIGLGLALPVLVASFFPRCVAWLPKPGRWMELFKQSMALPMLAAALWLVWVLGRQSGAAGMATLLALLLAWCGLLWALQRRAGRSRVVLGAVFAALLVGVSIVCGKNLAAVQQNGLVAQQDTGEQGQVWQAWSQQRVQQALAKGQPVFVDYTAAWCVTCQFNKQTVLGKAEFAALMQSNNVLLLRADWTRKDPAIAASLRSLGRAAVPVYALYLPSAPDKPHILSEILSLQAIRQILQPQ